MVEKEIEDRIIARLDAALDAAGVAHQTIGAWSCDGVTEDKAAGVVVTVKVHPRAYETFTVPTANFSVDVNLLARADEDWDGADYLKTTDELFKILHGWQKSIDQTVEDFTIEGGFDPAGLRMDGGDAGLSQDSKIWTCTWSLTLYGCILGL